MKNIVVLNSVPISLFKLSTIRNYSSFRYITSLEKYFDKNWEYSPDLGYTDYFQFYKALKNDNFYLFYVNRSGFVYNCGTYNLFLALPLSQSHKIRQLQNLYEYFFISDKLNTFYNNCDAFEKTNLSVGDIIMKNLNNDFNDNLRSIYWVVFLLIAINAGKNVKLVNHSFKKYLFGDTNFFNLVDAPDKDVVNRLISQNEFLLSDLLDDPQNLPFKDLDELRSFNYGIYKKLCINLSKIDNEILSHLIDTGKILHQINQCTIYLITQQKSINKNELTLQRFVLEFMEQNYNFFDSELIDIINRNKHLIYLQPKHNKNLEVKDLFLEWSYIITLLEGILYNVQKRVKNPSQVILTHDFYKFVTKIGFISSIFKAPSEQPINDVEYADRKQVGGLSEEMIAISNNTYQREIIKHNRNSNSYVIKPGSDIEKAINILQKIPICYDETLMKLLEEDSFDLCKGSRNKLVLWFSNSKKIFTKLIDNSKINKNSGARETRRLLSIMDSSVIDNEYEAYIPFLDELVLMYYKKDSITAIGELAHLEKLDGKNELSQDKDQIKFYTSRKQSLILKEYTQLKTENGVHEQNRRMIESKNPYSVNYLPYFVDYRGRSYGDVITWNYQSSKDIRKIIQINELSEIKIRNIPKYQRLQIASLHNYLSKDMNTNRLILDLEMLTDRKLNAILGKEQINTYYAILNNNEEIVSDIEVYYIRKPYELLMKSEEKSYDYQLNKYFKVLYKSKNKMKIYKHELDHTNNRYIVSTMYQDASSSVCQMLFLIFRDFEQASLVNLTESQSNNQQFEDIYVYLANRYELLFSDKDLGYVEYMNLVKTVGAKEVLKPFLMTKPYERTMIGQVDKYIELFQIPSKTAWLITRFLFLNFSKAFPKMDIMLRLMKEVDLKTWTFDDNFYININYKQSTKEEVKHKDPLNPKKQRKYTFKKATNKDVTGNKFTVNFIHSMDASILHNLIIRERVQALVVHDSFGVPIHMIQTLREEVRIVYIDMYEKQQNMNTIKDLREKYLLELKKAGIEDNRMLEKSDISKAIIIN